MRGGPAGVGCPTRWLWLTAGARAERRASKRAAASARREQEYRRLGQLEEAKDERARRERKRAEGEEAVYLAEVERRRQERQEVAQWGHQQQVAARRSRAAHDAVRLRTALPRLYGDPSYRNHRKILTNVVCGLRDR
jgi:hypothetical protein